MHILDASTCPVCMLDGDGMPGLNHLQCCSDRGVAATALSSCRRLLLGMRACWASLQASTLLTSLPVCTY
jgi:hypothetical protein